MQWKINLTQVICLRMRKITEAKSHWVNLRSPLQRRTLYNTQVFDFIYLEQKEG